VRSALLADSWQRLGRDAAALAPVRARRRRKALD
jgi:hypothetical protein